MTPTPIISYPVQRLPGFYIVDASGYQNVLIEPSGYSSTHFADSIPLTAEQVLGQVVQITRHSGGPLNLAFDAAAPADLDGLTFFLENSTSVAVPVLMAPNLVPGETGIEIASMAANTTYLISLTLDPNTGYLQEQVTVADPHDGTVDFVTRNYVEEHYRPQLVAEGEVDFTFVKGQWTPSGVLIDREHYYHIELVSVRTNPDTGAVLDKVFYTFPLVRGGALFDSGEKILDVAINHWSELAAVFFSVNYPTTQTNNRQGLLALSYGPTNDDLSNPEKQLVLAWKPQGVSDFDTLHVPNKLRVYRVG